MTIDLREKTLKIMQKKRKNGLTMNGRKFLRPVRMYHTLNFMGWAVRSNFTARQFLQIKGLSEFQKLFFFLFEICLQQSKRCSDLCAWECRKGQTPALGANGGGAGSPRECPGVTMGAAISHCNSGLPGCTRKPRPCSRRTAVNLARKNSHV